MSKVKVVKEDESGIVKVACPLCSKIISRGSGVDYFKPCKHLVLFSNEAMDRRFRKLKKVMTIIDEYTDGYCERDVLIDKLKIVCPQIREVCVDTDGFSDERYLFHK